MDQDLLGQNEACGARARTEEMNATEAQPEQGEFIATATFSPDENKIRLRPFAHIEKPTYERLRAVGFIWAPGQKIFIAPMWTPEREDLALELCGDIGDEDSSLVERAEERADRFETYSDKRAEDASRAHAAVESIAGNIPFGQPVLVGHHSEKRARRDAKRIEAGMQRAVSMWETSKYWERRAKGALHAAKYKERPDVRYRRIKGLEADKRKHEKTLKESEVFAKMWAVPKLDRLVALKLANVDPGIGFGTWGALDRGEITIEEASARSLARHAEHVARAQRWLTHIENRLTYERAMLGESGAPVIALRTYPIVPGGRVLVTTFHGNKEWIVVKRVTKKDGAIVSLSLVGRAHGSRIVGIEEVEDYREPEGDDAAKVAAVMKLAPLVNVETPDCIRWTKAEWDLRKGSGAATMRRIAATATHAAYRQREGILPGGTWKTAPIFLVDAKRVDVPLLTSPAPAPVTFEREVELPAEPRAPRPAPAPTVFDAMKDALKTGVSVVVADQLFVTPDGLAEQVVKVALDHRRDEFYRVLEPSAGTGQILRAVGRVTSERDAVAQTVAVEINAKLANLSGARCADFLALQPSDLGLFDAIPMNPPFANGADVEHVTHAFGFLKPGGRLVAIMSAGTKSREDKKTVAFRALVGQHGLMQDLPEDSFESSGTKVRTVIVVLDRP
jgi:hypothetical protein